MASLCLHNYCIMNNVPLNDEDEAYVANYQQDDMTSPRGIVEHGSGVLTRDNVVLNYFSH
jgi:hypothetical protein